MSTQLKVGGTWVATIAGVGDLTWSLTADAGSESASWTMPLPPTFTHPSLRMGALAQIKCGPANLWYGTLNDPSPNGDGTVSFEAVGIGGEGQSYLCLDSGGNTTSTPDVAIDQAIARGLPWKRPTSISNVPFAVSDNTDHLNYLTDLLDAWALANSVRWFVDADGNVGTATDPTTPTWLMMPGSARLGITDDDYASDLYVRYRTGAANYATATVSDVDASAVRRREFGVDATSLGVINSTKATSVGNGLLARGKSRYALTQAFTVNSNQLTTIGGTPAYLPFVKAGQMVRIHGVRDEQNVPLPYYDFVIGRVEYTAGADTISIAPINLPARNLADALSAAVGT